MTTSSNNTLNSAFEAIQTCVEEIKALLLYSGESVTHYTGLSSAQALIMQGSEFRISEGAYLNDTSEGTEVFDFLSVAHSAHAGRGALAELFAEKPFIGSFVTEIKHDDLALWRMYAKDNKEEANGCAITLNMKRFQESLKAPFSASRSKATDVETVPEPRFYRVAYRDSSGKDRFLVPGVPAQVEQDLNRHMHDLAKAVETFRSLSPSALGTHDLIELLNEIAYIFKSAEYQYEHELRLVIKGKGFAKLIKEDRMPPKVYIQLVPLKSLIEKITFGPKVDRPDEWAAAFHYSLLEEGYEPEILISRLPFK